MKILLSVISFVCLLFITSCAKYPIAASSGKEDMAYLLFISESGEYAKKDVFVTLDGETKFTAEPVEMKRGKEKLKGAQYKVVPGRRKIVVSNKKGEVIYSRDLLLSTQSVKQIIIP